MSWKNLSNFLSQGMKKLSVPDRAIIANMAPEYGATMGFFPVDEKTVAYLKLTDREAQADIRGTLHERIGIVLYRRYRRGLFSGD